MCNRSRYHGFTDPVRQRGAWKWKVEPWYGSLQEASVEASLKLNHFLAFVFAFGTGTGSLWLELLHQAAFLTDKPQIGYPVKLADEASWLLVCGPLRAGFSSFEFLSEWRTVL